MQLSHPCLQIKISVLACLLTATAPAQQPDILDFNRLGLLTWTNSAPAGSYYEIEWAPKPGGPWYRTWDGPGNTSATSQTTQYTKAIPLFYRVTQRDYPVRRDMEFIEKGTFIMGDFWRDHPFAPGEWTTHEVWVDSFWMDRYEVTRKLWKKVRDWSLLNGYDISNQAVAQDLLANIKTEHMPVWSMTWYDAVKWCNARSEMEGLQPVYFTFSFFLPQNVYRTGEVDLPVTYVNWAANGYRLPTEAEWEKAARGKLTAHHYPWPSYGTGSTNFINGSQANFRLSGDSLETFGNGTTPVGWYDGFAPLFPDGTDMANGYGLYDMAGNVAEWCWDWYDNGFYESTEASADNTRGPTDQDPGNGIQYRVIRGGQHASGTTSELRCAARDSGIPGASLSGVGFRCVRREP